MIRLCMGIALVIFTTVAIASEPTPWSQFRGPGGTGVAPESDKPPTKIGPDSNVKWKVSVPTGMSSPIIVGDKIFLTAFEEGKLLVLAYSKIDGKEIWRKEVPATKIEPYHKTEGSPAASTPASDGNKLVVYFGSYGLLCYDLEGKLLWNFELPVANTNNDFGSGTSPIIADGKVILLRDLLTNSKLYALDLANGSLVWEVKRDRVKTSWGSPCVWETPTGKELVVAGSMRVNGYDLKTGTEKWTVTGTPAVPCTTPVQADGKLIFAGWSPGGPDFKMPTFDDILKQAEEEKVGYLTKKGSEKTMLNGFFDSNDTNKDGKLTRDEWDVNMQFMAQGKNIAFELKPGGTGDITKTHMGWSVTKGLPYVPSPLVYRGQMYTINMRGNMSAVDVKTGKYIYEDEPIGMGSVYASPVAANGYLYLCGMERSVVVLKAGDSPEKVSSAKLDDRIAATPAIVDNTIYIRTGKSLYAFTEKK